jgi:hypothetical protein
VSADASPTSAAPEAAHGGARPAVWLGLAAIIAYAAALRFVGLADAGFRLCDEGWHLIYPQFLAGADAAPDIIYFKHGLLLWISVGVQLFGASPAAALHWAALNGLLTLVPLYFLLRRLFSPRAAAFGCLAFGCCRYILFYHRSNMSNGYSLLAYTIGALLLVHVIDRFGWADDWEAPSPDSASSRLRWLLAAAFGVWVGIVFTVRIQGCITLLGTVGAFGLAMVICGIAAREQTLLRKLLGYTALVAATLPLAYLGYSFVMLLLGDVVDWERTREWYGINFNIAGGGHAEWGLYLPRYLTSFMGWPLLVLGIAGLACECWRVGGALRAGRPTMARLGFLLSALGLFAIYLKTGLPWPRAYLYAPYFLAAYAGVALDQLLGCERLSVRTRWLTASLLLAALLACELWLSLPLYRQRSGYEAATELMNERERTRSPRSTSIIGTHSWPVVACSYRIRGARTIYKLVPKPANYRSLAVALIDAHHRHNIRFVVLDIYLTYTVRGSDLHRAVQQFLLTVPPDAVFANEAAAEEQAVADAFEGDSLIIDPFAKVVVLYDLKRLAEMPGLPAQPLPYTSDAAMTEQFEAWIKTDRPIGDAAADGR